ncbi:unnamed protein product [Chondrus crispus]|uniref:Uncharacterized protein n=1 Tax=Chondrus crispus TaxID=2769 RepID=R7Q997_CHOCR|nr:unnamed protein product [Chondrus crispus]CDF34624.1 unnamed protein product [Chondrus crispus]|eukprot:XP_005714443.1 unnamed protein product [Chondrus crispus]
MRRDTPALARRHWQHYLNSTGNRAQYLRCINLYHLIRSGATIVYSFLCLGSLPFLSHEYFRPVVVREC